MDDETFMIVLKLVFIIVIVPIIVTLGIFLGGPILSLWTLVHGWKDVGGWVKAGAAILPVIAIIALIYATAGEGDSIDSLVSVLLVLSPFISLGLLGMAYMRRDTYYEDQGLY